MSVVQERNGDLVGNDDVSGHVGKEEWYEEKVVGRGGREN